MKGCKTLMKGMLITALYCVALFANTACSEKAPPRVLMKTTSGDIVIELYEEKAPITVANFLTYVDEGFYNGTIFHRVIPGFVVQGGGHTFDFQRKPTHDPIKNEADNGLQNLEGTLSMARTSAVDSATSQFFINLKHNTNLDHNENNFGYAVFGKVIEGMETVEGIVQQPRGNFRNYPDAPNEPVVIEKVERL